MTKFLLLAIAIFVATPADAKLSDCGEKFRLVWSWISRPPVPVTPTAVFCSNLKPAGCFYNSNEVLKFMQKSHFDMREAKVHYATDVGLLRLKNTDLKAWDVHVFVEYKDKIYDASYAADGIIRPIDRQDFFNNYVRFLPSSRVRTVPAELHLRVFEEHADAGPTFFGAGLNSLSLSPAPAEAQWVEEAFPVKAARSAFKRSPPPQSKPNTKDGLEPSR